MLERIQNGDIFHEGAFIYLQHSMCLEKVLQIGCDNHKENVKANLMYDFASNSCSTLRV